MCLSCLHFQPCAGSEPDCNCSLSNKYTYIQLWSPEVTRVNVHLSHTQASIKMATYLHNLIVAKHTDSIGYSRISKLLNVPVSTVGAIIRKWKEHNFTINWPRPGAPCKISDRGVKRIIRRVVQQLPATYGELQKDLEFAGTVVSKK